MPTERRQHGTTETYTASLGAISFLALTAGLATDAITLDAVVTDLAVLSAFGAVAASWSSRISTRIDRAVDRVERYGRERYVSGYIDALQRRPPAFPPGSLD